MIKLAIFDLDGTLIDTSIDLIRAAKYIVKKYNIEVNWIDDDYISFVGNGAKKLIDRSCNHQLTEKQLNNALDMFNEYYLKILCDNAYIYDGLKSELDNIKSRGVMFAVATNKPHIAAVKMIEKLFGKDYFEIIVGATEETPKKPDPYSVNKILNSLNVKPNESIYFGDSDVDIYTAKNAHVEPVAVSWGFRSFESLISAAPSIIIDKPSYISKLF